MEQHDLINALWDNSDHDLWSWAESLYDKVPSAVRNRELEAFLDALTPAQAAAFSPEEFYAFLYGRFFPWKYTANNRLASTRRCLSYYKANENNMQELALIQRALFSFQLSNVRLGLKIACLIRGLGCAGASGLLSVLFPGDYGTVDQFVVKALCQCDKSHGDELHRIDPENITLDQAVLLEQLLRDKARQLNEENRTTCWSPRRVDKVLWTFGHEKLPAEAPDIPT